MPTHTQSEIKERLVEQWESGAQNIDTELPIMTSIPQYGFEIIDSLFYKPLKD